MITKQDELKQLDVLKYSYDMYEKTKKDTIKNMKAATNEDGTKRFTEKDIEEELGLINTAQEELLGKYKLFGGNPDDLLKRKASKPRTTKASKSKSLVDEEILEKATREYNKKEEKRLVETETIVEKETLPDKHSYDPQATFDVIPLPSKGECYGNKTGKIAVAYLTAYDENMIVSPNLYNDNKVIDYIIKEKVLDDSINTDELIEGDRDAIVLFLRASGYGNEYPINATDNETGEQFETVVDLSKLQYKDFTLKGDANGWFDFKLPITGDEVKFKFLTHKDVKILERTEEVEGNKVRKSRLQDFVSDMDVYVENDETLDKAEKVKVRQAIRTIEAWENGIDEEDSLEFTHGVTNRMIMHVMSINGNTDRSYISNYIKRMNVRDARALRKYINENEPGIDYNITIERPESLGGGSMKVFLQLDQFLFLNVAE